MRLYVANTPDILLREARSYCRHYPTVLVFLLFLRRVFFLFYEGCLCIAHTWLVLYRIWSRFIFLLLGFILAAFKKQLTLEPF